MGTVSGKVVARSLMALAISASALGVTQYSQGSAVMRVHADDKPGLCRGASYSDAAIISFGRLADGRLTFNFFLTDHARADLGNPVTVSMVAAAINGRPINPPYAPHTRDNTYNFHGSILYYQFLGRNQSLRRIYGGDVLSLAWTMTGPYDAGGAAATCTIPGFPTE